MTAATKEQAWEIPTGLSRLGRKAAVIIRDFCRKNGMDDTGGCKVFYTPKQWQERSEPYGCESELIVCHDGGDHANAISMDAAYNNFCGFGGNCYRLCEELSEKLAEIGVFMELCYTWHSAVYKS
jgi:hypothetical protein